MNNKRITKSLLPVNLFYNGVANVYDKMIDFEKNLELRKQAYKKIFPIKGTIADVGCGIGLDSIALAFNGHNVFSFDVSHQMITAAKQNALKYGVRIKTKVSSFVDLPKEYHKRFNNVISVGNTIAHLNKKELGDAIKKVYSLLIPGGEVFLHILNYGKILKQRNRINNIASRDGKIIIRFYDFNKRDIDFNILYFESDDPKEFKLVSTKHYPQSKKEILSILNNTGFHQIKFSGNFNGEKFNSRDSKDLFIKAVKKL